MMGVISDAINTDITLNDEEIEDAKWFSREDVEAVFNKTGDAFMRPPRITIANQLLAYWIKKSH